MTMGIDDDERVDNSADTHVVGPPNRADPGLGLDPAIWISLAPHGLPSSERVHPGSVRALRISVRCGV